MPTYFKVSNKPAQFSLARCRLGHASFVAFEVALILLMQTSYISYKIVMENMHRIFIVMYHSKNGSSWIFLH